MITSSLVVLDGGNDLPVTARPRHRFVSPRILSSAPFGNDARIVFFRKPDSGNVPA